MKHSVSSTLFIGKSIISLEQLDSTNSFASNLCTNEDVMEGLIIVTDWQKNGRGQPGASWQSEAYKNLTFSLILQPKFLDAKNQFQLNKAISIAIIDALNEITHLSFKIKWPNDIYYNHKKIAGILIENQLQNNTIKNSIIGIGININQVDFDQNLPNPISLQQIMNKTYNLNTVLDLICTKIEQRYLILRSQQYDIINYDYLQNLYQFQEKCSYSADGKKFDGIIMGVSEYGKLLVSVNNTIKEFNFKEIEF